MLLVTEIFRHGQTCLSHAHTRSRRLIHLSEHQSGLLKDSGLLHLCPEVISFTGTLPNPCEDRVSAVLCGNIADELLNQHGFTDPRSSEKPDFSAPLRTEPEGQ